MVTWAGNAQILTPEVAVAADMLELALLDPVLPVLLSSYLTKLTTINNDPLWFGGLTSSQYGIEPHLVQADASLSVLNKTLAGDIRSTALSMSYVAENLPELLSIWKMAPPASLQPQLFTNVLPLL